MSDKIVITQYVR